MMPAAKDSLNKHICSIDKVKIFEGGQNVCFGDVPIHTTHTNILIASYLFSH